LIITNSSIVENFAEHIGGGLLLEGSSTTIITNSTIAQNSTAESCGGGISAIYGTVTIANSTITNNSAICAGGMEVQSATAMITNSTIANNSARTRILNGTVIGGNGGGLFLNSQGGTATITNSTIAQNSALGGRGGGLRNADNIPVSLQNTILAENTGDGPDDCLVAPGTVTSLGHNLIGFPGNCAITLVSTDLTGEAGLEPFMDDGTPGNGHFSLAQNSPAINKGNDETCPSTDQLGQPRVGPCDIGSIEFQGVPDALPPIITVAASPATLSPPNGKLRTVTVSGTITDGSNGSGVQEDSAAYQVIDEYDQIEPSGDVTLGPNGEYTFTVQLPASRNGNDRDGRRYTIEVSATDHAGNEGATSATVTVPRK
jgi:hypothetical protein